MNAGQSLFDRASLVHGLAGLAMGLAGFPWWVALMMALLFQIGGTTLRGLLAKQPLPWPSRNHVAIDVGLVLVGFAAGWWLDPFGFR